MIFNNFFSQMKKKMSRDSSTELPKKKLMKHIKIFLKKKKKKRT